MMPGERVQRRIEAAAPDGVSHHGTLVHGGATDGGLISVSPAPGAAAGVCGVGQRVSVAPRERINAQARARSLGSTDSP